MRTTVSIEDPLLEAAKERAASRGITVSELIEDALRVQLAATEAVAPRAAFRLITVKGELVDQQLDLDRISALIAEDDADSYGKSR
jgi:hypothetical protein